MPKPVIALLCTLGMEDFLANALRGLIGVGVDPAQVCIGCPDNALPSVQGVARRYSPDIVTRSEAYLSADEDTLAQPVRFGSAAFIDVSWKKVLFIRHLLEAHDHVVYADLDIAWLRNPLPYLSRVAALYPLAFQTEGVETCPPTLCCGFISLARSATTHRFVDAWLTLDSGTDGQGPRLDDQRACMRLIEAHPSWMQSIFPLPESLFVNGLGYRNVIEGPPPPAPLSGKTEPFIFHANWTIGLQSKRRLLAAAGTWRSSGAVRTEPAAVSENGDYGAAPAGCAEGPVVTVIYPVFDVRGDAAERIRLWTMKQDIAADRYRVIVAAGADDELDEDAIRRALRPHDMLLRIPGKQREADFWNVGARHATTPWLLFVEAHALPKTDSLSKLVDWIESHPPAGAVNFRVENLDSHPAARLMKRWFKIIQSEWAAAPAGRRLHRACFALRHDVFDEIGPFDAAVGQFAPVLRSVQLNEIGRCIDTLPDGAIVHEDSRTLAAHHDDTADYVRGEMRARVEHDPVFFEKYFGPPPQLGTTALLPRRCAAAIVQAAVLAVPRRRRQALRLTGIALRTMPAAILSLRRRVALNQILIGFDEALVLHPLVRGRLRWSRFLRAHRRVVETEQMRWSIEHAGSPLSVGPAGDHWPVTALSPGQLTGAHAIEHHDSHVFRWTHPVFILNMRAPEGELVVTLETHNLRPSLAATDVLAVVNGRVAAESRIAIDAEGRVAMQIEAGRRRNGMLTVAVVVTPLNEPAGAHARGRALGLPLVALRVTPAPNVAG
ncbi:MAG: putative nucleotide-diphospho-sugar transferase [Planctomycetia bacterium]|nr:putative nucleotide-diphospho-sugar transferase [Planctomycetia bacterium]